jgi:hypothetical protein
MFMYAHMPIRRKLIVSVVGSLAVGPTYSLAAVPKTVQTCRKKDFCAEIQYGDPDMLKETLEFHPSDTRSVSNGSKARYVDRPNDFARRFIEEATFWVNKSRGKDANEIVHTLDLFRLPFKYSDGKYVPFCAAGISYVAACVYAKLEKPTADTSDVSLISNYLGEVDNYHFFPSPSVWDMFLVANGKNRWMDGKSGQVAPKPGWLVIYDWGTGGANHVGVVEKYEKGSLHTIEFNTSFQGESGSNTDGGKIAKRVRSYPSKTIKGFVNIEKLGFEKRVS